MKPHLRLKYGIWSCVSMFGGYRRAGYGYSPNAAYEDWLADGVRIAAIWRR
jgi:ribosomal protein L37AE/L43A